MFIFPENIFIIVDDFNLPNVKWSNADHHAILSGCYTDSFKVLAETVVFEQLFQRNLIINYKNNVLDLVIFNNSNLEVSKCSFFLVPIDIAHPPLKINGPIFISSLDPATYHLKFNFCRANYETMNAYLSAIDWYSL